MTKTILWPLLLALGTSTAAARLPPPTPEEQAALEQKTAREKTQLEAEQQALARVQDRVAERYGRNAAEKARTEEANLPKTATVLPRDAGPEGRREPSAEAHGASAR
jgi:hypothetical protein